MRNVLYLSVWLAALAMTSACGESSDSGKGKGGSGGDAAGGSGGSGAVGGNDGSGGTAGSGGTGGTAGGGGSGGSTVEEPGDLQIDVNGLPAGVDASVLIEGPGGFELRLSGSELLEDLLPGSYEIVAHLIEANGAPWLPSPASATVEVESGESAHIQITYEEKSFGLKAPEDLALALTGSTEIELTVLRASGLTGEVVVEPIGAPPAGIIVSPEKVTLTASQHTAIFTLKSDPDATGVQIETPHTVTFGARLGGVSVEASSRVSISAKVTSAADDGPGSLRALIAAAAGVEGLERLVFDEEVFSAPTTISLRSALIIDSDLSIEGPTLGGFDSLVTLSGGGTRRIFVVDSGKVELKDLKIVDGRVDDDGGCILNHGQLTLSYVTVSSCQGRDGGAVANITTTGGTKASLATTNVMFVGNEGRNGGAIFSTSDLNLLNTHINANLATQAGGGIALAIPAGRSGIVAELRTTHMSENLSNTWGGGISATGSVRTNMHHSTLVGNNAALGGGGLYSTNSGQWVLDAVNVEGNVTQGTGGGLLFGPGTGNVQLTAPMVLDNIATTDGGGLVTAANTTITGGTIDNNISGANGGGIYATSTLRLVNSGISGNTATNGGGVYGSAGVRLENGSSVLDNTAGIGGGIYGEATSNVTILDSVVSVNRATRDAGGGIYGLGEVKVERSTVSQNLADSLGGGMYLRGNQARLTVDRSAIHGNGANSGGGIALMSATRTGGSNSILNSTVASNSAQESAGISLDSSDLSVAFSTVSGNDAHLGGGAGVFGSANLYLRASIVAGNTATQMPDIGSLATVTTMGYNLIGDRSGSGIAAGSWDTTDIVGSGSAPISPRLGALGDNGGPTWTMLPTRESRANNAIPETSCGMLFDRLTIDQRGFSRPSSGACEIGAVEL